MSFFSTIFYTIFFTSILSLILSFSVVAVTTKNPIHAILYLMCVFVNAMILLLLWGIDFLAFVLVIIYVGVVVVLFIFVVMLLDIDVDYSSTNEMINYSLLAGSLCFLFVALISRILYTTYIPIITNYGQNTFDGLLFDVWSNFKMKQDTFGIDVKLENAKHVYQQSFDKDGFFPDIIPQFNSKMIGEVLYTEYALFFLMAGLLLLVGLLGSVMLTIQFKPVETKQQLTFKQLSRLSDNAIFNIK